MIGSGTLTMFCCKDDQHYALTCSHVGCVTGERRKQAAFNEQESIQEKQDSPSNNKDENAKQKKYYYEDSIEENAMDIYKKPLGIFDKCHFDDECDIMSIKISGGIDIKCQIEPVSHPDWNKVWSELHKRVHMKKNSNPV